MAPARTAFAALGENKRDRQLRNCYRQDQKEEPPHLSALEESGVSTHASLHSWGAAFNLNGRALKRGSLRREFSYPSEVRVPRSPTRLYGLLSESVGSVPTR